MAYTFTNPATGEEVRYMEVDNVKRGGLFIDGKPVGLQSSVEKAVLFLAMNSQKVLAVKLLRDTMGLNLNQGAAIINFLLGESTTRLAPRMMNSRISCIASVVKIGQGSSFVRYHACTG